MCPPLIVSDIGVMLMAKQVAPNLELHVSTQAGKKIKEALQRTEEKSSLQRFLTF